INNMAAISSCLPLFLKILLIFFLTDGTFTQNITTANTPTTEAAVATTTTAPSATATPIAANTDVGPCTCDLTKNACDVNCCCDGDCTADDRLAFSQCSEIVARVSGQTCITSSVIFRDNTGYETNTSNPDLLCIITDNYQERNYYTVPDELDTPSKLKAYSEKYGGYSYQTLNSDFTMKETNYVSGDLIYTRYENNATGVLSLPRTLNSAECSDQNGAAYLYDQKFTCTRFLSNLATECQSSLSLDAATYYQNFKLVSTPEIFSPGPVYPPSIDGTTSSPGTTVSMTTVAMETTTETLSYDNSSLVDIIIGQSYCIDQQGIGDVCNFTGSGPPSPMFNLTGNDFCDYAVTEVHYIIYHNGTKGIQQAEVRFVFKSIQDQHLPLLQTFQTSFKKLEDTNTFRRSGNPGYLIGEPVLAGRLVTQSLIDGTERQAIYLDSNRENWLTIVTSTPTGQCVTEPYSRRSVKFGENLRSGCAFRVSYNNIADVCTLIQQTALHALTLNQSDFYIATFGNSDVVKVGDWVKIIEQNKPTAEPYSQKGGCLNIVLGMHIEILYANIGSLVNPQAKIIGISFIYESPQDIKFQCVGPYCRPSTANMTQTFEVVSSVAFIDTTQPAVPIIAEKPSVTAKLPNDFFYPFYYLSSASLTRTSYCVTLLVLMVYFCH
ncbi:unnamed protein product, partial [Owenia fusiformis]